MINMNNTLKAVAVGITLMAASAHASMQDDIKECELYADTMAQSRASIQRESRAISTGANILGAIIGGRDLGYAVEGAIRNQGYGVAQDMRLNEMTRTHHFNQCMRNTMRNSR